MLDVSWGRRRYRCGGRDRWGGWLEEGEDDIGVEVDVGVCEMVDLGLVGVEY